ncbi:MAG: hybrid sensor histidine kinase/response regulator, partial [Desulfocapsa sp.]|nr:hybrid sensor histidine kinase/response regulator [Desulfocapsa sp.]
GADDYITKPFVDDELLAKLKVFSKLKKTEEIDELKTSILQLFSHETKTPLNGILLGSKLILDSPSITPKIEEYVKLIQLSGERIHDLVRRILHLSNLRNNKILENKSKSVKTYLQEFTENKLSEKSKCLLTVNCPNDFSLNIDWQLFHEAFESVVENAIQYSPEGGTVTLTASNNGSTSTINVVDEGPGITPQIKDTIFNEFCSNQMDYHSKGATLSLAIGREIMHLHQGGLQVESIPGQGADFIFTFPSTLVSTLPS